MGKFLITGGANFIGDNFLQIMVNKHSANIYICLDALTYAANMDVLEPVINKSNFKFVKGNICDSKLVDDLFKEEQFDYVINFTAESHVDRVIEDPNIFFKTNVVGLEVLMYVCRKYEIKGFHQVSTDKVYGKLPLDSNELFTEGGTLIPSLPYSFSKASADLVVMAYYRTYGLPVTISRCFNNYGQYNKIKYEKLRDYFNSYNKN